MTEVMYSIIAYVYSNKLFHETGITYSNKKLLASLGPLLTHFYYFVTSQLHSRSLVPFHSVPISLDVFTTVWTPSLLQYSVHHLELILLERDDNKLWNRSCRETYQFLRFLGRFIFSNVWWNLKFGRMWGSSTTYFESWNILSRKLSKTLIILL